LIPASAGVKKQAGNNDNTWLRFLSVWKTLSY